MAILLGLCGAAWAWNEPGGEKDKALSLKPDTYRGMELFRICAKCHSGNGWGRRDGSIPQIAGQHFNVVVKQLADVRERNREVGNMQHFVGNEVLGSTQSLVDLAAYISELPMTPKNGLGPGKDLDHGEALYMDKCIGCHGDEGEGDNEKFYPRIHGQHFRYMLRQFKWIQAGERLNSHPDMQIRIDHFTQRDAEAVVDYVSRLKPPEEKLAPGRKWRNPDFD